MVIIVPPPGRFFRGDIPPCAWTMPLLMDRPRPVPADIAGLALDTVELVKDAGQIFHRDACPAVGDLDLQKAPCCFGLDLDRQVGWGILDGIIDDVHQHLLDQNKIQLDSVAGRAEFRS